MENYQLQLEKYADLAINIGINLKEHEGLIISGSTASLPLAREIIKKAYLAGAKHVEFMLSDDEMTLARYENARDFVFNSYPEWKVNMLISMYEDNYHHLFISAPNPELLKNISGDVIATDQKSSSAAMAPAMKYRMTGLTKWSIVAMPSPAWAKSVFPELPEDAAVEQLWHKIFDATRVSEHDPVKAWQIHNENLQKYKNYLNEKQFEKLVFKAPGTDLEVFLAEDHLWMGGSKVSQAGHSYVANIPTEEVFTTPHRLKVNGTLKATKPLSLNGKLVEDFGFTFKDGQVVDFYAAQGKEVIEKLLSNDDGAKYLGEVALVQDNSPISNTGILFNNTLFDENASVHFALGRAYAYAMKNGSQMTQEELEAKGANYSLIHVDFMVGGPEMEIVGYEKNGTATPLFKDGNWLF